MIPFFKSNIHKPLQLEVRASAIHGNGVFALTAIKKGALVEKAPVILLSKEDREYLQATTLFRYYFVVPDEKTPAALGLGYSSVYNHSYTANAQYEMDVNNQCLIIKACTNIAAGEEITLNYNGSPNDAQTVYFN